MIASLFRKSTPLNYTIVIASAVVFFMIYQISQADAARSAADYVLKFSLLAFVFASLFMTNFVVKKNGLSKDSAYTVLFYLVFLLFFPSTLGDLRLVMANFFVLLSMRRLVSLHSVKATKEKIFDASLWIFLAAMFHFWCILFIALVFISVLFHAARDYRNWFLPVIACCTAVTVFLMLALLIEKAWIDNVFSQIDVNLKVNYFTSNYQNAALSVYATIALFFLVSLVISLSNRPLILHSSYQKVIWYFVIAVVIFVISPHKTPGLPIFTFAPLAIMATSHIESAQVQWQKNVILLLVMLSGITAFFVQV